MLRQTRKAKQEVIKIHLQNLTLSQISKKLNIPKTIKLVSISLDCLKPEATIIIEKAQVDLNNWTKEKKDGSSGCLSMIPRKIRRNF